MKKLLFASLLIATSSVTLAKLAPLSDEAKAKAAEAAAKTAWTGKVDNYQLCKSQDKVAAGYYKSAKATGKETKAPAAALPACADPGAFVYTVAAPAAAASAQAKPIEAVGARAPAATAVSPPSTTKPDAMVNPAKKS